MPESVADVTTPDIGGGSTSEASIASTRLHPRVPFEADLSFQSEAGLLRRGRTGNISGGGLFVRTEEPCAPGSLITVLVPLPSPENAFWATAEVRWRRDGAHPFGPPGMGVEFVAVDSRSRAALREFLRRGGSAA